MKIKTYIQLFISLLLLCPIYQAFAQREEDGNASFRKYGVMDANLVRVPFHNRGIASEALGYVIEYPKGSGHQHVQGIAPLIVTHVRDVNDKLQAICETAYGSQDDRSEDGLTLWQYEPIGGFANPIQNLAAMSDDEFSWPDIWPDKMDDSFDPGWPGVWNGYFGKGIKNADLEAYYVIDDDPDEEFQFFPDANDPSRRGLGTQMYIRGLQWSNVLVESHCFWLYDILNEGTTQYDSMYVALFADFYIGGEDEDYAGWHSYLDLAYCYDENNIGQPGAYSPVPAVCYAYLESPTIGKDGLDNDRDGIFDESRNSGPGVWTYGSTGYYNDRGEFDDDLQETNGSYYERDHWSGDEDGDWESFSDDNGNGQWDPGELLNDDVGADGIGPFDEAYTEPDEGEGDGIPTSGEPDFDKTDLDEGDQLGLVGFWAGNYSIRRNQDQDDLVWQWCQETVSTYAGEFYFASNLGAWWHSGPIVHEVDQIQRFSFSFYCATGPSSTAQVEDAARKKKTVQKIYNANYRFAEPPKIPTLTAYPGDGKVYLYWDREAESTFDRFFKVNDFEGYSLYKSTEPTFADARLITDGFGTISYKKPIFRCDKKDSISGFFPGTYNGVQFYLGEDTGLKHSYVDEDVINGQTYYYALASFDYGYVPEGLTSIEEIQNQAILPSECLVNIDIDVLNNVESIARNCAVVTPTVASAGYTPPGIKSTELQYGPTSKTAINYEIFNPFDLKEKTYLLQFDYPDSGWTSSPYYQILGLNNGAEADTICPFTEFASNNEESPYFDGLIVKMDYSTDKNLLTSEFTKDSKCNMDVIYSVSDAPNWDLDIIFTEEPVYTTIKLNRNIVPIKVPFYIYSPTIQDTVHCAVIDWDYSDTWGVEDVVQIVLGPKRGVRPEYRNNRTAGDIYFSDFLKGKDISGDSTGRIRPQPGDVYQIRVNVPPQPGETYEFNVKPTDINTKDAKDEMADIRVVPNPYVVTERWEPFSPYLAGRGPMEIHFTHLPKDCTIRIFTVQGYLVDTIEHHSTIIEGTAVWDVMSKDNMHIAPGNYIYHVEAPGIGQKVGRFMVIK